MRRQSVADANIQEEISRDQSFHRSIFHISVMAITTIFHISVMAITKKNESTKMSKYSVGNMLQGLS